VEGSAFVRSVRPKGPHSFVVSAFRRTKEWKHFSRDARQPGRRPSSVVGDRPGFSCLTARGNSAADTAQPGRTLAPFGPVRTGFSGGSMTATKATRVAAGAGLAIAAIILAPRPAAADPITTLTVSGGPSLQQ